MSDVQEVAGTITDQEPNALMQVIQAEHIEAGSALEIQSGFAPFFADADEWRVKAQAIKVTDISQKADMAMARVIRLKLKDIRVQANKKREALKENSLRYGKAVQGAYNILEFLIVPLEKSLEESEKFAEVQEAKRQAELKTSREIQLTPWQQFVPFGLNLGTMTEDDFAKVLAGSKLQAQAKIEAEMKAEAERLERIRAEEAERQRIQEENARLKSERDAREKAMAVERAKAEAARIEQEKKLAAERAKADAALKAERDAREKLEREAREKAAADQKAKDDAARIEADRLAAIELADKKAKSAPDKIKLIALADLFAGIELPTVSTPEAVAVIDQVETSMAKLVAYIRKNAIDMGD